MFETALEKLRQSLSSRNIQKSGIATGDKGNAIFKSSEGSEGGNSPDIGELASEAVVLFESGELEPELTAIEEWATSKGLPEEDASEFASAVVDSYFGTDDEGDDLGDDSGTEGDGMDDEGEGAFEDSEPLDEIEKSILSLRESQSVLAEGMNQLLEREQKILNLEKELGILKSMLTEMAGKPVTTKQPVTESSQVQKSITATVPQGQAKEIELSILKGIKAGKLSVEEMTYFESTGKLSQNALEFIKSEKSEKEGNQ